MPKYVVEAQVCDIIRSVPVEKKQAESLKRQTKIKIPRARIKVKKA